jgi:ribosomal protein S18 acetylase RimI-like enzyme
MSVATASTGITIEPATGEDISAAATVYQAAAEDLSDRLRAVNPWTSASARADDLNAAIDTLRALAAERPRSILVARDAGEIVGMAAVQIQRPHAHIAFLFVRPGFQDRGIGRALLDALRAVIDQAGATVVSLASSRDARAWQRYLRFGLRPGPPVMAFRAAQPAFPTSLPDHPALVMRPLTADDLELVTALDVEVRGADRRAHLKRWIADDTGMLTLDRATGEPAGFAIVSVKPHYGQIGPVVSRCVENLPVMLDLGLSLAGRESRQRQWRVDLSSRNQVAVDSLLRAGFTVDALITWFESGPVGLWDRYIFRDEDAL